MQAKITAWSSVFFKFYFYAPPPPPPPGPCPPLSFHGKRLAVCQALLQEKCAGLKFALGRLCTHIACKVNQYSYMCVCVCVCVWIIFKFDLTALFYSLGTCLSAFSNGSVSKVIGACQQWRWESGDKSRMNYLLVGLCRSLLSVSCSMVYITLYVLYGALYHALWSMPCSVPCWMDCVLLCGLYSTLWSIPCAMPCCVVYAMLCGLCRTLRSILCSVVYTTLCAVLFVLCCSIWSIPWSMIYTGFDSLCHFLWPISRSMVYTVLFFKRAVLSIPCHMVYKLCGLYRDVWSIPCSMVYTVLYGLFHAQWSIPTTRHTALWLDTPVCCFVSVYHLVVSDLLTLRILLTYIH